MYQNRKKKIELLIRVTVLQAPQLYKGYGCGKNFYLDLGVSNLIYLAKRKLFVLTHNYF